jgi:dynein regulatry complex protein 1
LHEAPGCTAVCRDRRIQERRKRIQERLAALREGESIGLVRKSETKQMDPGKQQSLESVRKIMALRAETSAAVKSVPLQGDAAENARRIAEEQHRQDLRTKMLAAAEQSARKNAAVAMHWADLFTIDVPQVSPPQLRSMLMALEAPTAQHADVDGSAHCTAMVCLLHLIATRQAGRGR